MTNPPNQDEGAVVAGTKQELTLKEAGSVPKVLVRGSSVRIDDEGHLC